MGLMWVPRGDVRRLVVPAIRATSPHSPPRVRRGGQQRSDGTVEFPLSFKIPGRPFSKPIFPESGRLTNCQVEDVARQLTAGGTNTLTLELQTLVLGLLLTVFVRC